MLQGVILCYPTLKSIRRLHIYTWHQQVNLGLKGSTHFSAKHAQTFVDEELCHDSQMCRESLQQIRNMIN